MTQEPRTQAGAAEASPVDPPVVAEPVVAEPVVAEPVVVERGGPPLTDSIADGVGVRSTYAVNLEVFEGPLDLLLHLVRRHELDILDIPISFIAEKYIEYIGFARSLDIEVAGEYLLMAATLAFLKSRELLPPVAGEDEEEGEEDDGVDPREELIRRLIEYERFRDAGLALAERPISGRDVFSRGGDISVVPPEPGLAPVTLFRLAEAYNRVLDRARINAEHEVVIERVTVRQRMTQLSSLLSKRAKLNFEELFLRREWGSELELRQMLVVTLMSVLEMVKLGVLGVHQAKGSESLELERRVEVEQLQQVISDFRGDYEDEEEAEQVEAPAEEEAAPAEEEAAPAEEGDAPSEEEAQNEAALTESDELPAEAANENEAAPVEAEGAADEELALEAERETVVSETDAPAVTHGADQVAVEQEPGALDPPQPEGQPEVSGESVDPVPPEMDEED